MSLRIDGGLVSGAGITRSVADLPPGMRLGHVCVTPVTLAGQIGHHLCARVHKDIACFRRGGLGTCDRLQPRSTRRSTVATGRTHRPATRSRGIPEATVARLPLYLRALTALSERSVPTVSSEELAAAAGVNSAK